MNRSKLAVSLSACLLPLLLGTGCVRERVVVVHDPAPAAPPPAAAPAPAEQPAAAAPAAADEEAAEPEATTDTDVPADQVETPPPPPGREYIWIKGHWRWAGRWVWVGGHYQAIRRGHEWVAGHWEHRRHRSWVWVPGHWRRL